MTRRTERRTALLQRGETVGVVAPGFAVVPSLLKRGLEALRRMGYEVRVGEHALAREGYLAGNDEQRLDDLLALFEDPEVRAIWFARGGYGTARLLDRIPWKRLRDQRKTLIGYSDLTALFAAAVPRWGGVYLYGPVVTELGDPELYHAGSLRASLAGEPPELRIKKSGVLRHGRARGPLMGGNLSVLAHLSGTLFFPDLRGAVLFIEETGEEVYRIDRMFTQLRQAGALNGVAAILLGALDTPPRRRFPPQRPLRDVVEETFGPLGVPVVVGLAAGHVKRKRTLPLGARTIVDTHTGSIRFEL